MISYCFLFKYSSTTTINVTVGTTAILFGMSLYQLLTILCQFGMNHHKPKPHYSTGCIDHDWWIPHVFLCFILQLILDYFHYLIMGNYYTHNLGNTIIH